MALQKANPVLIAKTKLFVIGINALLYYNTLDGARRLSFVEPAAGHGPGASFIFKSSFCAGRATSNALRAAGWFFLARGTPLRGAGPTRSRPAQPAGSRNESRLRKCNKERTGREAANCSASIVRPWNRSVASFPGVSTATFTSGLLRT